MSKAPTLWGFPVVFKETSYITLKSMDKNSPQTDFVKSYNDYIKSMSINVPGEKMKVVTE